MPSVADVLLRLDRSRFRSSFHLDERDKAYVREKGRETITSHARDFVSDKLAPAEPVNDGRQTPMKGHPVFKAMHATACCCRSCLQKWYRVPKHVELSQTQQDKIVNLLMAWISREMEK